jgi:NADH-quinone oxidoreductase subunit J
MPQLEFLILAAFTVVTAILALESKQIVYGAISLGLSFLGVAGLFLLLEAPFVALFQVIVYVGAVAVLIIFTVMLVGGGIKMRAPSFLQTIVGVVGGLSILMGVGFIALQTSLPEILPTSLSNADFTGIGMELTGRFSVALQLLGLLLAASVIGALTMAKRDK